MAPRLNKRQQRELEELEALGKPAAATNDTDDGVDDNAEEPVLTTTKPSGFAALFDPGNDEDKDEDKPIGSKAKKSKKKKKTHVVEAASPPTPSTSTPKSTTPLPARNEKKAAKKAKAKARKAGNDELDEALAELSLKYSKAPVQSTVASQSFSETLASLLSVSLSHLDSEAEMRRFFGSKVIQASKSDRPGSSSSSRRQPTSLRSNLTRPKPAWAHARLREGLTVRALSEEEQDDKSARQSVEPMRGERWWTVEYSKRYRGMTKIFIRTVQSGDPQGLFDMAQNMPWHADTLLQMAQVYRHRDEHGQAVDFMERAMFAYERAFIGTFTFTTGLNRLDFDIVENRPFFLALHRQTADLQRRGCLRTAFEFARLLYSLDPWLDPHGALFHLDYLAFKAGMTDWLLSLFKVFSEWKPDRQSVRLNPTLLPGWMYARALALKVSSNIKDRDASASALVEAVTAFPSVAPLLADKLDATLPPALRAHREFRIEADGISLSEPTAIMHLLSHLYVQRSLPLWKDHADWFTETITTHFSTIPSSLSSNPTRAAFLKLYEKDSLRYSVYRHAIVLEYRTLFRYIPKTIFAQKSLDCDPLPPLTAVSEYDDLFFEGVDMDMHAPLTRRQRQAEERRLAMIIPDAGARAQFQAMYAVPHIAAMFPGGILQMIQSLQDMPPDLMENLQGMMMMNNMGEMEGLRGEMPGQMPGEAVVAQAEWEELEDDLFEDEEDSEEEDGSDSEPDEETRNALAAPFRALSNWVVRGIWGNAAEADDSSDEERENLRADID